MRAELVLSLGGEEVDAGNAAALANKLSQMANGAVYGEDKKILPLHDRKLDALEDLIEAANGKPVLVAYWFKHDLERIWERFTVREIKTSRTSPIGTRARSRWRSSTRVRRPWAEPAVRRFHPRLVRADLVAGALPADQRPALAAGAERHNCGHPPHYHEEHH